MENSSRAIRDHSSEPEAQRSSLCWVSHDPSRVPSVLVQRFLIEQLRPRGTLVRLQLGERADSLPELVRRNEAGLALWALAEESELTSTCRALMATGEQRRATRRVCYLHPRLAASVPLLVEAGAQIVVTGLISLQSALERLLPKIELSGTTHHPLTANLHKRLPWGELDHASEE